MHSCKEFSCCHISRLHRLETIVIRCFLAIHTSALHPPPLLFCLLWTPTYYYLKPYWSHVELRGNTIYEEANKVPARCSNFPPLLTVTSLINWAGNVRRCHCYVPLMWNMAPISPRENSPAWGHVSPEPHTSSQGEGGGGGAERGGEGRQKSQSHVFIFPRWGRDVTSPKLNVWDITVVSLACKLVYILDAKRPWAKLKKISPSMVCFFFFFYFFSSTRPWLV